MSKRPRILIEVLAPPFLAALVMLAADKSDSPLDIVLGFFPSLIFFYGFGVIPSLVYGLLMELWFRSRLSARCGLFGSILLSGVLGAGAGFSAAWLGVCSGVLTQIDISFLVRVGAIVGLLLGFYVGQKQASADQHRAGANADCP
jgi:hypothetical protein